MGQINCSKKKTKGSGTIRKDVIVSGEVGTSTLQNGTSEKAPNPPNWPILYPFPLPCGIQVVLPTTLTELISWFLSERYLSFSIKL